MTLPAEAEEPRQPSARLGEGGLLWRVLRAHWDMKGATRAMLSSAPSEATLLKMVLGACLVHFAARTAALMISGADAPLARIGADFVAVLIVQAPFFYVIAALTGLVARAFKGQASWRQTRAAVFWAAVASAPAVFAATVLAAAVPGPAEAAMAVELAGSAYFGYAFCVAVAMANEYRSAWGVFGVTAAALAVIVGALKLISGGGF